MADALQTVSANHYPLKIKCGKRECQGKREAYHQVEARDNLEIQNCLPAHIKRIGQEMENREFVLQNRFLKW